MEIPIFLLGDLMGILSDTSIKKRIIPDDEIDRAKTWYQNRDWSSIDNRVLIDPFVDHCVGPFSYDIHLGEEAFLINERRKIPVIGPDIEFNPNDVVLVLSREYLGIPRTLAVSILPRFSLVRKGILLSMTKIDPTWYGRIAVGMVNQSNRPLKLNINQPFCTLVLHSLSEPCSTVLGTDTSRALGKESLDYFLDDLMQ